MYEYLYFGPELRSSDVYLHIVKTMSNFFSLNFARVRVLGWSLLGTFFFFRIFFFRVVYGAYHLKGILSVLGFKYFL